jgi:predicted dehydrogenase
VLAVASRTLARSEEYAEAHRVPTICADLDELLALPQIQIVDLCVPNHLHRPFAERAAAAGKHIVCTKPLAAYVGQDLPDEASNSEVSSTPRPDMLKVALADAQAMVDSAREAGVQLMYGENWVHAPAFRRAQELLRSSEAVVLEMRGWETHSGSHTPYAKLWRYNGGGALIRLAAHPIAAMVALKKAEGEGRGEDIVPVEVSCEVADLSRAAAAGAEPKIATGWVDVENWGCLIIRFSDGTRGVAIGSDNQLGGMESHLKILASTCQFEVNLSPNNMLRSYATAEGTFGEEYMMEKAGTQAGWNTPIPNEDWCSGHQAMCEEFVSAVGSGRRTASDGELGLEVTRIVYSGYLSAAEGRRVALR